MITSLKYLLNSVKSLGIRDGFRYWKIYHACKKNPWLVKHWEQVYRWESAKLENSEPKFSQMLEDWTNQLKEHRAK